MKRTLIQLISIFLAFLFLVGNTAFAVSAADKISLPHPSGYFGKSPETEKDGSVTVYTFSGYASFPEELVDKYVADLTAKGLKLTNNGTMDDGDILRRMEWKNDSCITLWWRKTDKAIEVRVQPCVTLTTTSAGNASATAASGTTVTIPSPADYFGDIDKSSEGRINNLYYCYGHKTYPKEIMETYIRDLKKLGLTGDNPKKQSNGDMLAILNYNGKRAISIRWYVKDQYVWFNVATNVAFAKPKQEDTTVTTKPTTPAAPTPVSKDGYLPDITKFLGVRMYDNRASRNGSWQYSVTINCDDNGKKAVREYYDLLQSPEYKLEIIDYQIVDYTLINRGYTHRVSFRYTGEKDIEPFLDDNNQMSHVMLLVNHIKDIWGFSPSLYVSADYKDKLIDSGKTASVRVIDKLTGGNEYDVVDDDDEKHTVPCGVCNNTGECQTCGGDGYLMSSASDKEDRNCYACTRGKCSSCKGDGWLN